MVTKLGQFTKLGHLSFLNCPNFVTIFCQILKMDIIFFDIPSNPPLIAVRNSLTDQFFQKNDNSVYFRGKKEEKKMQIWREEKGHFSFLNCSNFVTIFCQVLKMNIFFLISLAIPCPSPSGIHWPINFSKKNEVSVYFHQKKLGQVYIGISILVIPDHILFYYSRYPSTILHPLLQFYCWLPLLDYFLCL